jgi:hypothetical protein
MIDLNSVDVNDLPTHSELGASQYSRWAACPGSIRLCVGIEKKSSVYAEEGTIAHEVAASSLLLVPKHIPGATEEMAEAVAVYIDYITLIRKMKPSFEAVEQKFHLKAYHEKLFGTADYVAYFANTKTLHVVDYKHGAGVAVEVKGNKQLQYYGLGALSANNFPIAKIRLTIVQPRCYHEDGPIRSWDITPIELIDFAETLIDDAKATENPDAPLNAGDHCRWCAAQAVCPAIHNKAVTLAQNVFSPAASYDPKKLSTTLQALDQIEAWCKAVRAFAYQEAEAGRIPPGFKLVEKRATRKWKEGINAKTMSAEFPSFGKHFYTEPELKSPAQIEKIIPKEEKPILEKLVDKISSGKNLVEDNEKNANRQAIAPKAVDVFGALT